ncbi:MAG: LLM class F420-dependent oxidoreductase [bacterium]|nr:LLM class F420-dependent oxidoreductase [bacterium]
MKLGLMLGYSGPRLQIPIERVQLAERLGFDSVWTAEAYGSDAITPLAWIAAHTERIRLGTAVIQLAGRTPAMAAMQIGTLDQLAPGRVICGLGVSGPQIVEGWYGQPWGKPYWRIRDYVQIMKKIFKREEPVEHAGREFNLPFTGEGSLGIGKPLKSILHMNPEISIWLGTGTDMNVRLTAEIADGWMPLGFVPGTLEEYRAVIEEGFRRAGNGKSWKDFEIQAMTSVIVTDDIGAALQAPKPMIALYVGGMGHKNKNFHNDMMVRRGYPEAAARIQELYLAGRKTEAAEAVPDEYIDEGALLGPPQRIRERFREWLDAGVTGLTLTTGDERAMELMADLAKSSN